MEEANRLLGHPGFLEGLFSSGDGGRLTFAYHPALPAPGDYRAMVRLADGSPGTDGVVLRITPDRNAEFPNFGPTDGQQLALDLLARA